MQPRSTAVLISCVGSLSAILPGCGTLDLQATTLGQPASNDDPGRPFSVKDGRLRDPCGSPVILRGVNEMVTFISDNSWTKAFDQIVQTEANSVRLYWRTFEVASDLDQLLSDAEAHRLLPIIYVFNEPAQTQPGFPTDVAQAADYWTDSEILPIVKQHQNWLIIALREKGDQLGEWASRYDQAIARMRAAGITVPLAIDAPASGSDVESLLLSGQDRITADSLGSLLLNVNSGAEDDSPEHLADALRRAAKPDLMLPMLVGEISGLLHTPTYECGNPYAYETVLQAAEETSTGWLGWSWGYAQNQPCPRLDMTDGGIYGNWKETWGGDMAVNSPYSIAHTSQAISYTPGQACQSH